MDGVEIWFTRREAYRSQDEVFDEDGWEIREIERPLESGSADVNTSREALLAALRELRAEAERLREALRSAQHYVRFGNGQQQNLAAGRGVALAIIDRALASSSEEPGTKSNTQEGHE
jgi:hypothetical protein